MGDAIFAIPAAGNDVFLYLILIGGMTALFALMVRYPKALSGLTANQGTKTVLKENELRYLMIIPLLLTGLLTILLLNIAYYTKNSRVEVTEEVLKVRGGLYGRTIPLTDLKIDEAAAVKLTEDHQFGLLRRTNGIGMGDYKSGWFTLRSGEKALAFVTDEAHVVYVPTTQDYALVVSVAEQDAFIRALKASQLAATEY